MRLFVCLLDVEGRRMSDSLRASYESVPRAHGLDIHWCSLGPAAVLTASDDDSGDPLLARDGDWVAAGTARLDNRRDVERWSHSRREDLNDLQLILGAVARRGAKCVPQFLGDFAFVAWNWTTRTVVAACDAFAVRRLYYAECNGLLAFASRAEALASGAPYELEYLAELLAGCIPSRHLSVYAGVHPVPAGTLAVLDRGRLSLHQYWSAAAFEGNRALATSERDAITSCRELLAEAVQVRLTGHEDKWLQLSGGLDSSTVASVAQWLVERGTTRQGLTGTVTYVDRQGTEADERQYSDAIVAHWHLRNETIIDSPIWCDDRYEPPRTDLPSFFLPFYPRERRLCALVRAAGARVLLTGIGGDELFTGTMLFFADWLAKGRVRPALREMAQRAAVGHVSFWELAFRNALLPLLPQVMRHRLAKDQGSMPAWVAPAAARRFGLRTKGLVASSYAGPRGHKYYHAVMENVAAIGSNTEYGVLGDSLDLRHPFLYRPLVEFALQLPPELCARPHERKWVLREAMRGILPDVVRTRVGKGSPLELYARSLITHRQLLEPLVRNSVLADLGLLDGAKLRAAFHTAPHKPHCREEPHAAVHFALCIEAWLQLRSGLWPARDKLAAQW